MICCAPNVIPYQRFPRKGALAKRVDLHLADLLGRVECPSATIYSYVVASVKQTDGHFVHHGSGPNLQGGYVTLCACKHRMRTFLDCDKWVNCWVAGFSRFGVGGGRNALIYLMRVAWAFASYQDLWNSPIPLRAKMAKAAHLNPLGDLFQPKANASNAYVPQHYLAPIRGHTHRQRKHPTSWHGDICHFARGGKPAALLVGDPKHSFLWETPRIFFRRKLTRGEQKWTMAEFLSHLRS